MEASWFSPASPTGRRAARDILSETLRVVLDGVPEGVTVILLDHQPSDARHAAKLGVALQLSGHTHGGLILGSTGWPRAPTPATFRVVTTSTG